MKMLDIPTFRAYAKISDYIYKNFPEGASCDKILDLIGLEFNLMTPLAVDRHYKNMVQAGLLISSVTVMKGKKIDWDELEKRLKGKLEEMVEQNG